MLSSGEGSFQDRQELWVYILVINMAPVDKIWLELFSVCFFKDPKVDIHRLATWICCKNQYSRTFTHGSSGLGMTYRFSAMTTLIEIAIYYSRPITEDGRDLR